jgi:hypothetical protein
MVAVRDGEKLDGMDIVLTRGTAVTGTIVDESGEPLQGVVVRAFQLRYTNGRTAALGTRERRTDDRGRYRLFGLVPGSYVIGASVEGAISSAQARGYAPVYYPGTVHATEGTPVNADLGRDVAGIDLVFTETPTARVSGVALTAAGTPLGGNVMIFGSGRSGALALEPQRGPLVPDGRFTFVNVPPGDYVVQAFRGRGPGQAFEFGAQLVTVTDRDPAPLEITTSPGATLSGRLVREGGSNTAAPGQSFAPYPADFDYAPAIGGGTFGLSQRGDGTFTLTGLWGPTRFRFTGNPDGWYLKSVTIGGVDMTDTPFDFGLGALTIDGAEVVLSNAGATVAGHVTDAKAVPVSSYSLIVFATDQRKWFTSSRFLRLARPAQDGSFEVTGLPPGEYWLAAVEPVDGNEVSGDWQKPEALEQLSFRAQRVTLTERERYMAVLRLIRR